MVGRPPQVVDARQLMGASIQDDVLDEQRKQLFADAGAGGVATVGYIRAGPEGVATHAHSRDQDFRWRRRDSNPRTS